MPDLAPIFIVGFMGVGKSTLGKRLADEKDLPFVDLDRWIEASEGKSINQIFDEGGESYFRELETNYLRDLPLMPSIVATGGGTPCFHENMKWMLNNGYVIYLKASEEKIYAHLLKDGLVQRPMLKNKQHHELKGWISKLMKEREKFYLMANEILTIE
jgi:shikimate kinase